MRSRLHTSILSGWDRAVLTSLAEDLGHEFVAVVLPLIPEASRELMRLVRDHGYHEVWLLREHAPILFRHARADFLSRADAVLPMLSPVEVLAAAARDAGPDDRAELRMLAMAALEREQDPMRRGRALLDWAPLEPEERAQAMIAEALGIALSVSAGVAHAIVGRHVARLDASQRARLRTFAIAADTGSDGASLLLSLARSSPPAEASADVRAAIERCERDDPKHLRYVLYAALDIVPFDVLRPCAEALIRSFDGRRDICFAAHLIAPHAPPDVLDLLVEQADAIDVEIWARAEILADVARYHPTRREALRDRLRDAMERVVGDETLGHRMEPDDVPSGANPVVLQVRSLARASALLGSDAREMQRRLLTRVAAMPSDFDDRHDLDAIPWDELGGALDPSLREDAVRAVLALRHRPAALKGLGKMVAEFPAEARHLGLHGLSRLADATPPEALSRVLVALSSARSESAAPPPAQAGKDRPKTRWTRADERSLAALATYLKSGEYIDSERIELLAEGLTAAAAVRAIELVSAIVPPYKRRTAMMALASAPLLGASDRDGLLSGALALIASERMFTFDARELAQALLTVCGDGDAAWAERLAAFFDARPMEREPYLELVEAFAPLLRRVGGPELCTALAEKLRAPLPIPEFARPWTHAMRTTFEA